MPKAFVLAAIAAIAAACSSPPAPSRGSGGAARDAAGRSRSDPLDDTLHVAIGRSASADDGRLVLTFTARLSDSRCPANVVCVWMGDAAVRVSARVGRTSIERELHTALEPRSLSLSGYVVTMVGLTPYPGTEDRSTPTALLRVIRQ